MVNYQIDHQTTQLFEFAFSLNKIKMLKIYNVQKYWKTTNIVSISRKKESSFLVSGNVVRYSLCGKQDRDFSKLKTKLIVIYQFYFLVSTCQPPKS